MLKDKKNSNTILVDFDGTCVTHEFPDVGKEIGAVPVLIDLVKEGHKLILFTMRSDKAGQKYLQEAVDWFNKHDIPLYGIQVNPTQKSWTDSPKAFGHWIIDDTAIGVPLVTNNISSRPYVDWYTLRIMLEMKGLLPEE